MNQKIIGIVVLIVGILLAGFVFQMKAHEDEMINSYIQEEGTCYLTDGTCLHSDRNWTPFVFGGILSSALIILGLYLIFFDKTQELLLRQQKEISHALHEAKQSDAFRAFLAGFTEDEQKILKAVHEQEGILQSTLRFRTGLSKASVSIILSSLEKREIVSRTPSGKSSKVYLRQKF